MMSVQLGAAAVAALLLLTGDGGSRNREVIVGVTWLGDVVHIDPITGSSVLVGPTGYGEINCLAKNSEGRLLAIGNRRLIEIDPHQGTATSVRSAGLSHPTALAFSPDDVLYGVDTRGVVDSVLYRYELTEPPPDPEIVGRMTDATGQSIAIYGLSFSSDGTLYAWSIVRGLMKVNRSTGFCADLNGRDIGNTDIESLASSRDGRLYGVRDHLYLFDLATGSYSRVGSGEGFDVRGAEFYPISPPAPSRALGAFRVPPLFWSPWVPRLPSLPIQVVSEQRE
jgi:hypothetical protein